MCVISATVAGGTAAAIMANTAVVASVASAAMTTYGAIQQANAVNARNRYAAKVAQNNAQSAQYEADYAREKSQEEARQQREQTQRFIGKQRGAMAASGVAVESGSFSDLLLDTAEQGKLDELAILHQGDMNAWRLEAQAEGYAGEATAYESAQVSPIMAGVTAGVGGVAKTGMTYYSMTKPKVT